MERRRRRALLAAVTGLAAGNVVALGVGEAQAQVGQALPQTTATPQTATVTNGALYYHQSTPVNGDTYHTVASDGSNNVSAPAAMPYLEGGLAWSPDGTKTVYANPATIVLNDAAFSHETGLVPGASNTSYRYPRFLPDGSAVAYLRTVSLPSMTSSIWTVKPDGTGDTALPVPAAVTAGNPDEFDILPNGDYLMRLTVGGVTEVDLYHPGAASATKLLSGNIGWVVANPDGLHATVTQNDPAHPANGYKLENVDLATKAVSSPIASGLENFGAPVWSPDGKKISYSVTDALAASVGGAANTSHAVIRDLAAGTTIDVVAPTPTLPNRMSWPMGWQPVATVPPSGARAQVDRVGGDNRVATAIDTSQLAFNNTGAGGRQAASAVLSRSDTFADALAGSALAAHKTAPLLLTPTGSLDATVQTELKRVLPPHAPVYLLGGTSALSDNVFNQVTALGFTPVRVSGNDRNETAVAIAGQITSHPHTFLVGTGHNFPDALAAGASAGAQPDAVVLLSDDGKMPKATADYLAANHHAGDALLGVGVQGSDALKTSALSGQITQEFRGTDRFDTATQLAEYYYSGPFPPKTVGIATGSNWPDALGGGALLGAHPGPLLLDGANGLPPGEVDYLKANGAAVQEIVVFGGVKVVPQTDVVGAADDTKGTGNWDYFENRKAPAMP